ncbi:MAG: Chaperone SurA precursor [Lentisphaerae bacterium ADurb.BinA184]|nr:MAG: Chaperone SurA precursor [Lentisphaerae bacterium ADurb.BinA184]
MMNRPRTAWILRAAAAGLAALAAPAVLAAGYADGIAAIVNGEVITVFEVVRQTHPVEAGLVGRFSGADLQDKIGQVRRQMVQQLIDHELIYAEFKERGVTLPVELIDGSLDDIVRDKAGGSWQSFEDQLVADGGSLAEFRSKLEKRLAVDVLLNEVVRRPVKVLPDEVTAFYQARGSELGRPSRLHLQVITVAKDGRDQAGLDARMKAIGERLAAGEDFGAVAKDLSDDPSRERGGDLGWIEAGSGRQDFVAAVAGLAPGAVAQPVDAAEAVYILRFVEGQGGEAPMLDEGLRTRIENLLRAEKQEARYREFIGRLRKKFYVKTFF